MRRTNINYKSLIYCISIAMGISGCYFFKQAHHDVVTYRLAPFGYSHLKHTLLYIKYEDYDEWLKGTLLGCYNKTEKSNKYINLGTHSPFDFAWSPQEDKFIVTYLDGLALFKKYSFTIDSNYMGMSISSPIGFQYTFCVWNNNGKLAAINCSGLGMCSDNHRLGLYDAESNIFNITDIDMDNRPIIWKNDHTLYITKGNTVEEIDVRNERLKTIRTIPIGEEALSFFGIYNEKPLVKIGENIMLGEQILIKLQHRKTAVITTEKYIFVSQSATNLVVFNDSGIELCHVNPGRLIRFGSIGEDESTVYGISESTLLRLSVKDNSIHIDEICDLNRF